MSFVWYNTTVLKHCQLVLRQWWCLITAPIAWGVVISILGNLLGILQTMALINDDASRFSRPVCCTHKSFAIIYAFLCKVYSGLQLPLKGTPFTTQLWVGGCNCQSFWRLAEEATQLPSRRPTACFPCLQAFHLEPQASSVECSNFVEFCCSRRGSVIIFLTSWVYSSHSLNWLIV